MTFPKFRLEGESASWPGAVEDPDKAKFTVEFEAFDRTEILPWALPADCGVNDAEKVTLSPGVSVVGRGRPLMPNPEPVAEAPVIETGPAPELVRVAGKLWVLPVCTFPKLIAEGAGASWPATTEEPETGIISEVFEATNVAA